MSALVPGVSDLCEQMLAGSHDGILAFDTACRYTVWNPAMERITGVPREQCVGRCAFEVFPFLKETGEEKFFSETLAGHSPVVSERPYTVPATGRSGVFEARYSPLHDARGAVVGGMAIVRDVTRERQLTQALETSEQKFRRLFEQSADAHVLTEGDCIVECNRRALELLGVRRKEDLLQRSLLAFAPAVQPNGVQSHERMLRFLSEGRPCQVEWEIVRADGRPIPVEVSAALLTMNSHKVGHFVLRDISERMAAEEQLCKSEERYRTFFESTSEAIWCVEPAAPIPLTAPLAEQVAHLRAPGTLTECNRVFAEELAGRPREEVLGRSLSEVLPDSYVPDALCEPYLRAGARLQSWQHSVTGPDGAPRHFLISLTGIVEDEHLVRTWGCAVDITERIHLRHQMVEMLEGQLQHIGRELHDGLGQVMTGIRLLSEQLADKLVEDDSPWADRAAKVASLSREAVEQAHLVYYGLSPILLRHEGLVVALADLAAKTSALRGVPCTFTHDGEGDVREPARALHLYRIAQEALNNALKHASAQSIDVDLAVRRSLIRLRIQDDGIGFDVEESSRKMGMGLDSLRYRARLLGADLRLSSTPGEGTIVACTLNRDAGHPASEAFVPSLLTKPVSEEVATE